MVVGGGNAGCAAAIAAARHGARTLLVERYGFLGGTATASMVGPWMTFHSGEDRIVGGIAQEIVERLVRSGASPGHLRDSSDYVATITPFDPEVHKALLFEMMREAGVALLLHAYVLDAEVEGDTVRGARVRDGRRRCATHRAHRHRRCDRRRFRRCGGRRADAAGRRARTRAAGQLDVSLEPRRSRRTSPPTFATHPDQMRTSLTPRATNGAGALTAVAGLHDLWEAARRDGIVEVPRELVSFFVSPYPDEVTVNMTRVVDIDPLDPDDLTRAEVEARLQVMQLLAFFRQRVPGFANARVSLRPARRSGSANRVGSSAATRSPPPTCSKRAVSTTRSHAARIRSTFTIRPVPARRRSGWRPARLTRFPIVACCRSIANNCSLRGAASRRRTKRWPRPD